jgi:uncharacterized membrane protein
MSILLPAFLIGLIAGLRTFTAPAAVSWAAYLGRLALAGTPLAFLGFVATPFILTVVAVGELIYDKLPQARSRKESHGFGGRLVGGGLCGTAIGATGDALVAGLVAGAVGAVIGTLAGYEARVRLAKAIGRDTPAALLEDAVTVGGAVLILWSL